VIWDRNFWWVPLRNLEGWWFRSFACTCIFKYYMWMKGDFGWKYLWTVFLTVLGWRVQLFAVISCMICFGIIAQDMEVLVFCLFYTPLQLLTCTCRLLGLCLSSPVTQNKARKCWHHFVLARHIQVLEVEQQVLDLRNTFVRCGWNRVRDLLTPSICFGARKPGLLFAMASAISSALY
jgi:hypothetical protein